MSRSNENGPDEKSLSDVFLGELIIRANCGDHEAAREVLDEIATDLLVNRLRPQLAEYLGASLRLFLDGGVGIERSLGLEADPPKGGRPRKFEEIQIMAVDLLLRDHLGFRKEQAVEWIAAEIGADRKFTRGSRKEYDSRASKTAGRPLMDGLSRDDLLYFSGKMREKVERLFTQTKREG